MNTSTGIRGAGGAPPLKRLATTGETKLPRGTKGRAVAVAEGRENQPDVTGAGGGRGGRRLRSAGSD